MAVAWSKDKVGRAVGDLTIRDPVVLTATLPRFLLSGDRGTMHLDLDNVAEEIESLGRSEHAAVRVTDEAAAGAPAQADDPTGAQWK